MDMRKLMPQEHEALIIFCLFCICGSCLFIVNLAFHLTCGTLFLHINLLAMFH